MTMASRINPVERSSTTASCAHHERRRSPPAETHLPSPSLMAFTAPMPLAGVVGPAPRAPRCGLRPPQMTAPPTEPAKPAKPAEPPQSLQPSESVPPSREGLRAGEMEVRFVNAPETNAPGGEVSAAAREGDLLLNVGDSVGLRIPRACVSGLCGSCTVDVVDADGATTVRACQTKVVDIGTGEMVVDVARMKEVRERTGSNPMARFDNLDTEYRAGAAPVRKLKGFVREVECATCDAKGDIECYACDGTGTDIEAADEGYGPQMCLLCSGSGMMRCPDCQGTGIIKMG